MAETRANKLVKYLSKWKRSSSRTFLPSDSGDGNESELAIKLLNGSTAASLCWRTLTLQTADPRVFCFFLGGRLCHQASSSSPRLSAPIRSHLRWWGRTFRPLTVPPPTLSAAFSTADCSRCSVAHARKHARTRSTSPSQTHTNTHTQLLWIRHRTLQNI